MRWEASSQEELLQDIAIAQAKTNVDVGHKEGYCSRYYEDGWTVEYGCTVLGCLQDMKTKLKGIQKGWKTVEMVTRVNYFQYKHKDQSSCPLNPHESWEGITVMRFEDRASLGKA